MLYDYKMQFEQQLKDTFREAEMPVRPEVWERIKSNLTPPTPRNPWGGKRWLVLLLLLCVAAWGSYKLGFEGKSSQPSSVAVSSVQPPLISPRVKGVTEDKSLPKDAALPTPTPSTKSNQSAKANIPSASASNNPPHAAPKSAVILPQITQSTTVPQAESRAFSSHTTTQTAPQAHTSTALPLPNLVQNEAVISTPIVEMQAKSIDAPVLTKGESKQMFAKPIEITQIQVHKPSTIAQYASAMPSNVSIPLSSHKPTYRKWHYQVGIGTASIVYGNELYKQTGRIQALSVASISAGEDVYSNIQVDNDTLLGMIANNIVPAEGVLKMTYSDATQFIRAGVQYHLHPRLSIGTGLSLYRQQVRRLIYTLPSQTSEISLKDLIAINASQSYALNQAELNPNSIRAQFYKIAVAEIPLNVQYEFLQKGRSGLHVEGGTSIRFLVNSGKKSIKRASLDSYFLPTSNENLIANFYKPVNFTARMGVGYNYHLTARQSLYLQASATKLLQNMYWQGVSISRPLIIGLEAGVKF